MSNKEFNLIIAFESYQTKKRTQAGKAVMDSSFHHFLDFNLDPDFGVPSFVDEVPVKSLNNSETAMTDTLKYFENIAGWLS